MRPKRLIAWVAAACVPLCGIAQAAPRAVGVAEPDPSLATLDTGFRNLYELNFQGARADFQAYQDVRPDDPLGKAAEAASYLYEEFNAKGVFSSKFFLNDSKLLGGVDGKPAQNRNQAFVEVNDQARQMAKKILQSNPQDVNGLLALTIADGMESDYDALIEKKQMDSLSLMRRAESEANTLLAIDPTAKDAYVALGASNYIIGCLPGYKRFFLRIGGIHGDKARGMQQMEIAAEQGRYLRPFAKILLALAYEREHQMDKARALLADLTAQFPQNPLFARELALAEVDQSRKP
jgi:hypothetical protein